MSETAFQLDFVSPQNLQVLQAYQSRMAVAKKTRDEFDGWLERINSLTDVSAEELTQIHGQLIAGGHLKFEIGSSNIGLRYQISPKGRQALDRAEQPGDSEATCQNEAA